MPAPMSAWRVAAALLLLPAAALAQGEEGWTLHGHDLGGQRYSPLREIDTATVSRLRPLWTWHSGVTATFQATPIVADSMMYVSLPFSGVAALDPATGRERWRYVHEARTRKLCCGPANRGVAVADGRVFVGTVDGRLVALDAATGRRLWDVTVAEYQGTTEATGLLRPDDPLSRVGATGSTGIGISAAPLVYDGRVYVGIAGVGYGLHPDQGLAVVGVSGQYGRPGLMAAFDAATGRALWRFDVTGPGWEGAYRTATPDGVALHRNVARERADAPAHAGAWRYGGGSIYATPVVDAERHLLIFGTGNPSPQMADASRPGDNLYTSSLVPLDLRTGRLVWHYQQVPHDRWGYDVASPPVLFDFPRAGRTVRAVGQASKTGWFFIHDRVTGELLLRSEPFIRQENLFAPPDEDGERIVPGTLGATSWSPVALHPGLALVYIAGIHQPSEFFSRRLTPAPGRPWQRAP